MECEFVIPTSIEKIIEVEKKLNFNFPDDFKKDIISFNSGSPKSQLFMAGETERVLEWFFSMNEEDSEYIVTHNGNMEDNFDSNNHIYFATDPFGNSLSFNRLDNAIYFYDHENDKYTKVAVSWTELKSMLYEAAN